MDSSRGDGERIGSLLDYGSSDLSAAVVGDVYVNRRLGIAFRFPQGWSCEDVREVSETAKGRVVNPEWDEISGIMQTLVDDHLPTICLAAPKDEALAARVGTDEARPSITVHFDSTCPEPSTWRGSRFSLLDHVEEDLGNFKAFFADYELQFGPERCTVSGLEAVEYVAVYPYHHEAISFAIPMREHAIYIARCPSLFEVRLCDFPDLDPGLSFDFGDVIDSITVSQKGTVGERKGGQ